jgi:hypothetical protein
MKRVNIIIDNSKIIYYHIFPLLVNHKNFRDVEINIKYYRSLRKSIFDCDILILLSKPIFNLLNEKKYILEPAGPIIEFLSDANRKVPKIIWMDTADGTSTTHFELLPFVHKYLKKQIFKDRSLYKSQLYGGRIFTEFYHQHFSIDDTSVYPKIATLGDGEEKLGISWNIGLGDMMDAFGKNKKSVIYGRFFNLIIPKYNTMHYNHSKKNIDILLKTTINLSRETVAFHREKLVKFLQLISQRNKLKSVIQGKRLSNKEFRSIMRHTKIFPSPFGWGEIGVRDYEAFIYGGVLLKPSVEHMETWPNVFINKKTYIPFKWDFSDIEEKINLILSDEKLFENVAEQGQEEYLKSISDTGMKDFTNRFIKQLED